MLGARLDESEEGIARRDVAEGWGIGVQNVPAGRERDNFGYLAPCYCGIGAEVGTPARIARVRPGPPQA